jgi:hypothetical protein
MSEQLQHTTCRNPQTWSYTLDSRRENQRTSVSTFILCFFFPVALQSLNDLGRLTYRRFLELFRHMVGLLGRVISPSQGLYLHRTTQHRKTRTNIHALSGIRTHDPSNQPAKTHASDCTATVTGFIFFFTIYKYTDKMLYFYRKSAINNCCSHKSVVVYCTVTWSETVRWEWHSGVKWYNPYYWQTYSSNGFKFRAVRLVMLVIQLQWKMACCDSAVFMALCAKVCFVVFLLRVYSYSLSVSSVKDLRSVYWNRYPLKTLKVSHN